MRGGGGESGDKKKYNEISDVRKANFHPNSFINCSTPCVNEFTNIIRKPFF